MLWYNVIIVFRLTESIVYCFPFFLLTINVIVSGAVIMGLGSMIFMVPHFTAEPNLMTTVNNSNSDNICRAISLREQDMSFGKYLMNCETRNAYKIIDSINFCNISQQSFQKIKFYILRECKIYLFFHNSFYSISYQLTYITVYIY